MLPVVKGFATTKRHILFLDYLFDAIPFFMNELGIPFIVLATFLIWVDCHGNLWK